MENNKENIINKINEYYTEYFLSMLKAFPEIIHLHFGIIDEDKFSLMSIKKKIVNGMEFLLEDIINFSELNRYDKYAIGLDLGCGLGGTCIYLAKKLHFKMVGITITANQIPVAVKNIKKYKVEDRVQIKYGDGRKLDFEDELFDFIIMIEVAMHVEEKEMLFNEIYRVLKPGGKLIMADVEISSYKPLMNCFGVHYFPEVNYYKEIGEKTGFKDYKEKDVSQKIHSWMKYYIVASGFSFQVITLTSLILKFKFISTYYFIKSLIFMKKILKNNLIYLGFDKKEIKKYKSIKRVRAEFDRFLNEGSIMYKFIVQKK